MSTSIRKPEWKRMHTPEKRWTLLGMGCRRYRKSEWLMQGGLENPDLFRVTRNGRWQYWGWR